MQHPYSATRQSARAGRPAPVSIARCLLLLALLLAGLAPVRAQTTPAWQSALALGQTTAAGTAFTRATATDASGAVYVTGYFSGQVAFGSTVLVSAGLNDVFVARYEPGTSTWAWATRAGGTGTDQGFGLATDGTNVYVTGYFNTSAPFFAGQPAATTLTSKASNDVFVAAYTASSGTGLWAKSVSGAYGSDVGYGVATDGTNVYVTGNFTASATFFAGQPAATTLNTVSGVGLDVFVAAYTASAGTGLWARSAGGGGGGTDSGFGLATDGTNVYVTGNFYGSADFFAGQPAATTITAATPVTSAGGADVFVAAYTASAGTGVWAKSAGGSTGADQGYGVATDGTNVYVTGYFNTSADFFAGQPAATTLTGAGGTDMFVAAYTASVGTGVWAKSAGGAYGTDQGYGVATDGTNVYVTGNFTTSAGFFAGQPAATTLTGTGQEVFVAAYTASAGTGLWAKSGGGTGTDTGYGVAVRGSRVVVGIGTGTGAATFGGYGPVPASAAGLGTLSTGGTWQGAVACVTAAGNSIARATAVDKATGAVYVTGPFTGQVAFGSTVLISAGGNDVFVARYEPGAGTWAWAKSAGGSSDDYSQGIAADGLGGVYVTGQFTTSATIAGQPVSGTGLEMFVASYAAADGTGRWAKSGGGAGTDVGYTVATDGLGGVYATGYFTTSGTFAERALSGGGQEMFVAAYAAADGASRWATSGGGGGTDVGGGIAADGLGGVYVTGNFTTSATFAGQSLNGTGQEVFVASYAAADGTSRWAKSGGGPNADQGNRIAADGLGGVYVTGYFTTSGTFAGQPALSGTGVEMFVAAYAAADGTGRWATSGGGTNADVGTGIAADGLGGVYVAGQFNNNGTFAGQALGGTGQELFVAAYAAADGTGRWAKRGGGAGTDVATDVATDGTRLFVCGYGALPVTFDAITVPGINVQVGVLAGLTIPAVPVLTAINPGSGAVGSSVTLTGSNLTGATAVTFGGTTGNTVTTGLTVSGTGRSQTITVVVPTGAATGPVTVTGPNGTSNGLPFTVDLTVDNTNSTAAAPYAIAAGTYGTITVTSTGYATLGGAVVVNTALAVSGTLLTACQPLTGAGSFTLNAGATLGICDAAGFSATGSSGAVQVAGTRSFSTDATYVYNGIQAQATGSGLPATVRELALSNAAGLTLTGSLTASTAATLATGVLTTGANALTLAPTAILSENIDGYATGTVQTTRPLATAGTTESFGGLGLRLTPSGPTLPGSTLVIRTTGTARTGAGTSQSVKRVFDIQPTVTTGLNVALALTVRDDERNGIAAANLRLFKSDNAGSTWGLQRAATVATTAASGNQPTTYTASLAGISSFSLWTLGDAANPLPVELTQFTATAQSNTAVRLAWATASEKNSQQVDVERSADGRTFAPIGTVAAAGSSSSPRSYGFVDAQLPTGAALLYYRLKQVDQDGTFSYSPVRTVALSGPAAGLSLYPNPAHGGTATLLGAQPGTVVTVLDALGRPVATATADAAGTATLPLPEGLAAGVYVVRAGAQALRLTVE